MPAVKEDLMRRAVVVSMLSALVACAGTAQAATISGGSTPVGPPPNGIPFPLDVDATPGEINSIEVVGSGASFIIRETGAADLTETAPSCSPNGPAKQFLCTLQAPGTAVITPQINVLLGDMGDTFRGSGLIIPTLKADGDEGDDTLFSGLGRQHDIEGGAGIDTIDYSDHAQSVTVSLDGVANDGGAEDAGAENVQTVERIIGGGGDDSFRGNVEANTFVGGVGVDRVAYNDRPADQPVTADPDGVADDGVANEFDNIDQSVENIIGGAGNDVLAGIAGVANVLDGGAGIDTATYAGRAEVILANLDDVANDGAGGELDNLVGIESLTGGSGGDFLTGSPGPNALAGGPGNDVLDGGDGADTLAGEDGNDQLTGGSGVDAYAGGEGDDNLTAFDGLAEGVDCGGGTDNAAVDVADTLANCETVRRLDEVLDVDRDGSLPPQDCNDTNAAIKPGAKDIPRNGIDEDCSGKDADFGKVRSTVRNQWRFNKVFAQATAFAVKDVPAGGVVRLKCTPPKGKKKACPFKTRTRESVNGTKRMDFLSSFKKRQLPVGTEIEVRIKKKDTIARVVRFTTRRGKVPKSKTLCLEPGKKKPGKC